MKVIHAGIISAFVFAATPAIAQETEAVAPVAASEAAKVNDGTDPTQLTTQADVALEHLDLRSGFSSQTLTLGLTIPVGESKRTSIRFKAPFVAVDVLGDDSMGLGDASVKVTRVLKVTRQYGIVLGGEVAFDTADRLELGTGKTVFKGSFIYAKFLKGGHIFAPSLVHNVSVAGSYLRSNVNLTTIDLYYVPRLSNPKLFMTIDPALNYDWVSDSAFGSLSVTLGRSVGSMLGGIGQFTVKPTVLVGGNRGANWGMQVGFKVVNF